MDRTTQLSALGAMVQRLEADARLDSLGRKIAERVQPLTEGDPGAALRGDWLGHALHPLLTDLPIGCFTSAFMLDLVGGTSSRKASQRLIGLGLVATVPTMVTGAVDYSEASDDPRIRRVGVVHGVGNLVGGLLYFRSWRSRRRDHHMRGVMWGALGGGVVSFTGYLGGHMAFAGGSSVEERGTTDRTASSDGPTVDLTADGSDLLEVHEVAERLGVSADDVETMVDQRVLVPAGGAEDGDANQDGVDTEEGE
ncbi:MAG: DUF2231 domain-containing protein [Acidimicrobiia bacterium]|nr:DUF2231 domain-containing protein [Acidimicrobiia bacterium]